MSKAIRYNTLNSPIVKEYYYVVNFKNLYKPIMFSVAFLNANAAKIAIEKSIEKPHRRFHSVMKGSKIIKHIIPIVLKLGKMGNATKYDYPENKLTKQERKTYRTVLRRRLRRMGIYTKINTKRDLFTGPIPIKLIKNTQTVSDSPNTDAKVIQIQRKPKHIYYYILKKKPSEVRGQLLKLKVIRYDSKLGICKKVTINILRNDLLIPYLKRELITLITNNNHLDEWNHICSKLKRPL